MPSSTGFDRLSSEPAVDQEQGRAAAVLRTVVRKLVRDPLFHFALIGVAIFALARIGRGPLEGADTILVTASDVARLSVLWERTWRRAPTRDELEGLVADHVREEILYREAIALGLDRDDTIIRRRLRQKMEFLSEDLNVESEPGDEILEAFLSDNAEAFRIAPRLTFRHVYLSRDARGEAVHADADRLLVELASADAGADTAALGDRLPLPFSLTDASQDEVARLFGPVFAESLVATRPGAWRGPVESGYGLHVVFVEERQPARAPELAEVRDAVRNEWLARARREANETFYRTLRESYDVSVEWPEGQARAASMP